MRGLHDRAAESQIERLPVRRAFDVQHLNSVKEFIDRVWSSGEIGQWCGAIKCRASMFEVGRVVLDIGGRIEKLRKSP
jgi:hypothetical protein